MLPTSFHRMTKFSLPGCANASIGSRWAGEENGNFEISMDHHVLLHLNYYDLFLFFCLERSQLSAPTLGPEGDGYLVPCSLSTFVIQTLGRIPDWLCSICFNAHSIANVSHWEEFLPFFSSPSLDPHMARVKLFLRKHSSFSTSSFEFEF